MLSYDVRIVILPGRSLIANLISLRKPLGFVLFSVRFFYKERESIIVLAIKKLLFLVHTIFFTYDFFPNKMNILNVRNTRLFMTFFKVIMIFSKVSIDNNTLEP